MLNLTFDAIGTFIIIVAPIAIVLFLILVVVAYPWLLIVALVLWFLHIKYVPDEVPTKPNGVVTSSDEIAVASQLGAASPALPAPPRATKAEARAASSVAHRREGGDRMIVLTWNLGRRTHPGQAELVRRSGADIVALQEVSAPRTASLAREFAAAGLVHQHGTSTGTRSFPFASMIASRWPIRDAVADGLDVPFPERVQVAIVATPFWDVEVLNVHVPAATSSGVDVKVATFEGIAQYLSRPSAIPRIMVGDFNAPKSEISGRTFYWGSAHQQGAERAVIEGHAMTGLHDAYRHVNGAHADAASWRASNKTPRRYDHVFASQDLVPVEATYGDLEQIKADKMSDHAPLRVVFRSAREPAEREKPVPEARTAGDTSEEKPRPISIATETLKNEESPMTTTDDADLRVFLKNLSYRRDVREHPNDHHRREFHTYWKRASNGGTIAERTLQDRLTWANLGFRAGKAFGSASATKMSLTFDHLAAIYMRERA